MSVRLKPLHEQVIVITGATSGIGLATAKAAAQAGARVVLTSRNEGALKEVQQEIQSLGAEAIYVDADVSRKEDLERVAESAKHFGGFDTWINNAGVSIFGRMEQVSDEDHRRLFDTNFWGVVNGSMIAVHHLRQRGGALINLGSVVSDVAIPVQGMYSASKAAVQGFTDALRLELEADQAPISVTLVKPGSINTPFVDNAKKYIERQPKLPPPVYQPEEVAKAILHAAVHGGRDIYVGGGARVMSLLEQFAPRLMDWYTETVVSRQQLRDEPVRNPSGALHRAGQDGRTRGDQPGYVMKTSLYTRAAMHPVLTSLTVVTAGILLGSLLRGRR